MTEEEQNQEQKAAEEIAARKSAAEKEAVYSNNVTNALSGPGVGQINISGSDELKNGALEGLQFGQMLYGQGISDVGKEASNYSQAVQSRLGKDYAGADVQRQLANQALAKNQARLGLGGTTAFAAQEQLRRQGSIQAAQSNQDYQDKAMALFGKNVTAKQQGMSSQYFAGKGVGQAATPTPIASYGGGLSLALLSMGLMSKETYASEAPFVNKQSFEYIGYIIMITPIIPIVLKNGKIARIFSFFAHKYVLNLTGEKKSILGEVIKRVGSPICTLVGKLC